MTTVTRLDSLGETLWEIDQQLQKQVKWTTQRQQRRDGQREAAA